MLALNPARELSCPVCERVRAIKEVLLREERLRAGERTRARDPLFTRWKWAIIRPCCTKPQANDITVICEAEAESTRMLKTGRDKGGLYLPYSSPWHRLVRGNDKSLLPRNERNGIVRN